MPSAERIGKLALAAGHLVHMPAHIYSRVGDHPASAHCNELAIAAEIKIPRDNAGARRLSTDVLQPNMHFLAFAACMDGNFAEARDAAAKLVSNVAPGVKAMPELEGFLPTPMIVLFAFERWNDLLKFPAPDASLVITNAIRHSFRGIAFANTGKTAEAEQEQKQFHDSISKIPADTMYDPLNKAAEVIKVYEYVLSGAVRAQMRGEPRDD